ncbi:hypothetical protein G6F35_017501 [Rhizopus arrhizus]|nr:hypothetical protein G6F35_017501 [Rhizopus arrhizus]
MQQFIAGRRGLVARDVVRQRHALPGLAGVDGQHGADRHLYRIAGAGEARREAHHLVVDHQPHDGTFGDVEHHPAILDRRRRDLHAGDAGVAQDVRGQLVEIGSASWRGRV